MDRNWDLIIKNGNGTRINDDKKIIRMKICSGLHVLLISLAVGSMLHCTHDTFVRDIPDLRKGNSQLLQGIQISADSLQLERLEDGFDSLQIRIWLDYDRKDTMQIISIKRHKGRWSAYYTEGIYKLNFRGDSVLYFRKCGFAVSPILGWHVLMDSLSKLNIYTLPHSRKIISINDFPMDGGNSVTIEVSSLSNYRVYMYEVPSYFKKKFKEAENVDNILALISSQFGIRYLERF